MSRPAERMTVGELAAILADAPPDAVVLLETWHEQAECPDCGPVADDVVTVREVAGAEYARGILLIASSEVET